MCSNSSCRLISLKLPVILHRFYLIIEWFRYLLLDFPHHSSFLNETNYYLVSKAHLYSPFGRPNLNVSHLSFRPPSCFIGRFFRYDSYGISWYTIGIIYELTISLSSITAVQILQARLLVQPRSLEKTRERAAKTFPTPRTCVSFRVRHSPDFSRLPQMERLLAVYQVLCHS